MAWVETRITRATQPQDAVGIDWNNPLTRGLVFSSPLSGGSSDLAGGKKKTTTGAVGRGVNSLGQFPSYGAGARDAYPSFGPELSASTPATIFWIQEPRSPTAYSTVAQFRPSGSASPFLIYQSSSVSQYHFVVGPHGGAAPSFSTAIGAAEDIVAIRFALVCKANLASRLSADYVVFKNGQINSSDATAPFGSSTVTQTTIGANSTGGDPFEGLIGNFCIWNRALSDAEIKSLSDNPWQIFEPEVTRLWIDDTVSEGGAATVIPIGVQATCSVGTPSATGAATVTPAGVSASSAVGTPIATGGSSIAATVLPAGVQATAAVGTVTATGAAVALPAGVTATGAVGMPVAIGEAAGVTVVYPAGVQASSAVGTPTVTAAAIAQPLGVAAIAYVGTPTIATGVSGVAVAYPSGVQAIGQVGTLIATGAAWTAAVGVQAVASVGAPFAYEGDLPAPPISTEPNESAYYQRVAADILAGRVSGPHDALFLRLARRRSNGY